ncbi:MAG: YraN family protein [Pseudomonadota bacterium]|nr:YraN family protein [Pseudomonadota bacterium]
MTRNYTTRHGEIDLVMLDHHTIVFVELRYRESASHGDAAFVTAAKQRKLINDGLPKTRNTRSALAASMS